MVSNPIFNPNNLAEEMKAANSGSADNSPLINRAINGLIRQGLYLKLLH